MSNGQVSLPNEERMFLNELTESLMGCTRDDCPLRDTVADPPDSCLECVQIMNGKTCNLCESSLCEIRSRLVDCLTAKKYVRVFETVKRYIYERIEKDAEIEKWKREVEGISAERNRAKADLEKKYDEQAGRRLIEETLEDMERNPSHDSCHCHQPNCGGCASEWAEEYGMCADVDERLKHECKSMALILRMRKFLGKPLVDKEGMR